MFATATQLTGWQPGEQVRPAELGEGTRLFGALTAAFIDDPPTRWLYPEPERYLRDYPAFARAFGGAALELGTAWCTEGLSACAFWLPPGAEPEAHAVISVAEESVARHRQAEVLALFEAMGEVHPREPHWYLPLIGVDPVCQGQGLGGALLRESLGRCDRDGLPAYLEASNPHNIPFYERHGFRRREPLRVGSCPPVTPMWRDAVKAQRQW